MLGIGFTVHNRCIVIFGLIFVLDLLLFRRPGGIARPVKQMRIFLLTGFFLLPSILWESFYHLVFIIFRRLQIPMTTPTFLEQVLYGFWHSLLWGYVSENFRPAGFLTFPYLYQHMNGILALLLLAGGPVPRFSASLPCGPDPRGLVCLPLRALQCYQCGPDAFLRADPAAGRHPFRSGLLSGPGEQGGGVPLDSKGLNLPSSSCW